MTKSGNGRIWYALVTLFLVNFLNYFDRLIPAVVLEPIREDFKLDDTWLGVLSTSFILIYALAGIPLGRLADRVARPRMLAAGVFVWSLLTGASGAATNFAAFFLVRLGVGVGEATCLPAASAMIGDMFSSEKRARATSVFMLGLPLGTLACFALGGYVAQHYGWRTLFYLAAAPGLVCAVLCLLMRDPPRGAQETFAVAATASVENPFRRILAIRTFWWIAISGAAANFAAYAFGTFLTSWLIRAHGLTVAQAGVVGGLVFGVTGIVGLAAGGWGADRLHQLYARGRLLLAGAGMFIGAPLLWLGFVQPRGSLIALTALLSVGWLFYFLHPVTVYAALQDVIEPRLRASAVGLLSFFQFVLGAAFGGFITGAVSDMFAGRAMRAAGATEMSDAFRAAGLQSSLTLLVPLAIACAGVALFLAARTFVADRQRMQEEAATT